MIVDAHHHLWDPAARVYPWMDDPAMAPIRRRYGIDELRAVTDAAGIAATLVVQAVGDPGETGELLGLAAASGGLIAGVVGWIDLLAPSVADDVAALLAGPYGHLLVGIRHQVQDEADPDWLLRPDARRGLRAVADTGLVYELLVRGAQRDAAMATAGAMDDVRFVLDHAGKPAIGQGETEPWRSQMAQLARLPNVTCKLSGLVTEAEWSSWSTAGLAPYVDHLLDVFGPDRLMAGSDWPVCELAAPHAVVWRANEDLVGALSPAERAAVLGGTAAAIYGVGPDAPS